MNLKNVFKKRKLKSIISRKRCSSFCMCFDSVVLENCLVVGEQSEQSERVESVVSPAVNMSSDVKDKDFVGSFGRKNKLGHRSFSRYVKAVFFETSLMKKMRKKKLGQKLYQTYMNVKYSKPKSKSRNNIPMNNNSSCEDNHSTRNTSTFSSGLCTASTMTKNSSSTSAASRCSSSSLSWNSRPESVENNVQGKFEKGNGKGYYGSNVGICLLLISLMVLVIWGKVCAICCTSTWLFFLCQWSTTIKRVPSENVAVDHHFPEIDTQLYKKKIIMEGLLERKHTRNRFPY